MQSPVTKPRRMQINRGLTGSRNDLFTLWLKEKSLELGTEHPKHPLEELLKKEWVLSMPGIRTICTLVWTNK